MPGTALEEIIGPPPAPAGVDYGKFSFTVKRWVLTSLAEHASAAVSASAGVPVLGCFQVRVCAESLTLTGTNMALTVTASTEAVSCAASEEHLAYLPAKKLTAILKEAPEGDFTVAIKKNLATLTAQGGANWTLKLPDGTHYPVLPDLSLVAFKPAPREKFLAGLKTVRHTVGKDAGNPPLMQVSIAEHDGAMTATSIAGSRCTRAPAEGFPFPLNIPAGGLEQLLKLLSTPGDSVEAGLAEGVLVFRLGTTTLMMNRAMAQFPDVDGQLLNSARKGEDLLTVDREELVRAVRMVRINASPDTSAIALVLSDGKVTAEARDSSHNSATETVMATWTGGDRVLTVNHGYLLEMLGAHPSPSCVFRLGADLGKRRSMVLLEDEESGVTGVISQMPPGVMGY